MSAKLLFATGGTGGHIFPALAIAAAAKAQGFSVSFIGQRKGMEAKLVPEAGFDFHGVSAGKWDRERPNPLEGVRAGAGMLEALWTVARYQPDLVLGFGGFASFPGVAAARLFGKPYMLHESNALPGKVTRWFAGGARHVALAQQATRKHLPTDAKTSVVGFPVREKRLGKAAARAALGLPAEGLLTYVTGGSQGSQRLNEMVPQAFLQLGQSVEGSTVLHSTGPKWLKQVQAATKELTNYYTEGFVDAILAWSAADLAITRGGYGTLSEAAYHGVPCIVVPLPSAAEDHQLHNARAFAKAGAGWVLEDARLSELGSVWLSALARDTLASAALAALALSPEGASAQFLSLLQTVLDGSA